MSNEILSKRLIELRKKENLTQQKVADKINVSRSSYSQYELGLKQPTIDTLKLLADLYHCSIDYLVGRYN